MPYQSLQSKFGKSRLPIPPQKGEATMFSNISWNLSTLPQQMTPSMALNIANYVVTSSGGLEKRMGLTELFSVTGTEGITMLEKFNDDFLMYAYGHTLMSYQFSTGFKTTIKTNFVTSDPYSGQTYGDYFFISNGGEEIVRVSRQLFYSSQSSNFTVGAKLRGVTSGATAIILKDVDFGTDGILTLGSIVGTFLDGEIISDDHVPFHGEAIADDEVFWNTEHVAGSPKAKVLRVVGPRLYAGNTSLDPTSVAYSNVDTGANPPFNNWTVADTAGAAGLVNYRNAGPVNAIDSLGTTIVVLADNGKWGFETTVSDVGGTLKKIDNFIIQRNDMGGARASTVTPGGMFYANKGGLWQLQSLGQSNIAFSQQEGEPSILLGTKYFDDIDLSNSDITYNAKTDTVFLTCAKNSDTNNLVIAYNVGQKTFSYFTGWNINRFLNFNQTIYGSGSSANKVWTCFDGFSDDGADIWTNFLQEIQTGNLETRKMLLGIYADAYLSVSTQLEIDMDIYNVDGNLILNKQRLVMQAGSSPGSGGSGYGSSSYGGTGFGGSSGGSGASGTVETFAGYRPFIRNFQRLRIDINCHDQLPHTLNWIKLETREKIQIRRRNMTSLTT